LAEEAPPRRSQRCTDRELSSPDTGPHEHQAGDVHAGDEQHAANGTEENEHGWSKVLIERENGRYGRAPAVVRVGIRQRQIVREPCDLGLRLTAIHGGCGTRQQRDIV
jgi:hypothetical protein